MRRDHSWRRAEQLVDFTFVRQEVEQFYGRNGNVSVDPVVILKLIFLLFWDNVPSVEGGSKGSVEGVRPLFLFFF